MKNHKTAEVQLYDSRTRNTKRRSVIKATLRTVKRLPLFAAYGNWRSAPTYKEGYTIALPMPMDMPFLLRLALEGLSGVDTTHCNQILVVPDGWGDDGGAALRSVVEEFDDSRLEMFNLRWLDYRFIRAMRPPGCARTHWMMVVNSVLASNSDYIFLHDADAFFLEAGGLERQFKEAQDRSMDVLGVTARWDPFFTEAKATISGTWEMLFSARWARKRSPMALYPGRQPTDRGDFGFDSTLYAQYLDHAGGTIGVMETPPSFVHFNGTIFTYRTYRDSNGRQVTDELFRLLLLSSIETALEVTGARRTTPKPEELAVGLHDINAAVQYGSEMNIRGYGEFRKAVESMIASSAFAGSRAERIEMSLKPFDEHFKYDREAPTSAAVHFGSIRETGLGQ